MKNIVKMRLTPEPFEQIKAGRKTVEIRINDEKRRQIRNGDWLEFTNLENEEKLLVRVKARYEYAQFSELLKDWSYEAGFDCDIETACKALYHYYTPEEEREHGVVGFLIGLEVEN